MHLYEKSYFVQTPDPVDKPVKLPIEVASEFLFRSGLDSVTDEDCQELADDIYQYALTVLKYCNLSEKNGQPAIVLKSSYLLLPEGSRSAFPKESDEFFGT